MGGMFYLLSMVFYIKGRLSSGKTRFFYFGGLLFSYVIGVLTKENVAILPLFIALYEFYFFQNFDLTARGKKILLVLAGGLLLLGVFGFLLWGKRYIDVTIEGYQTRTFTMSGTCPHPVSNRPLLFNPSYLSPPLPPQSRLRFPHFENLSRPSNDADFNRDRCRSDWLRHLGCEEKACSLLLYPMVLWKSGH